MSKTKTNVHSNFKCKNILKNEKSKKMILYGLFGLVFSKWPMSFRFGIYMAFVAYLILYQLVYNIKWYTYPEVKKCGP